MDDNSFFGLKVSYSGQDKGTEKVSVNMNQATLSSIDLLVDSGYYSNRSDFINQAAREALSRQQTTIDRIAEQHMARSASSGGIWFLGIYNLSAEELTQLAERGGRARISGYGMLRIAPGCADELVFSAIESIQVRGKVSASEGVKARFGLK